MSIYLSNSQNPFLNLATENFLYTELLQEKPLLFLWRNEASVIIGRAQNPWIECNLPEMHRQKTHLVRRQSGGGTVYHDLGNTNFTFLMPKAAFDKTQNLMMVIESLRAFDIQAEISPRNDILIAGQKVSGSAFRESKERAFHHGTLLISAELNTLENFLNPQRLKMKAKGVKSVRSPVINASTINTTLSHHTFCEQLAHDFRQKWGGEILELNESWMRSQLKIAENAKTLSSWDWRFGKTLKFEQDIEIDEMNQLKIEVNHAAIKGVTFDTKNLTQLEQSSLSECLANLPYQPKKIRQAIEKIAIADNEIKEKLLATIAQKIF